MTMSDASLRRRMTQAAVSATVIFVGFAVSYGIVSWFSGSTTAFLSGGDEAEPGADATEVHRLIEEHDCWTGRHRAT